MTRKTRQEKSDRSGENADTDYAGSDCSWKGEVPMVGAWVVEYYQETGWNMFERFYSVHAFLSPLTILYFSSQDHYCGFQAQELEFVLY